MKVSTTDMQATGSEETEETLTRRQFLNKISIALSAVIAFLVSPLLRKAPQEWRPVGAVSQFKVGETVEVKFPDASPLPWSGVVAQTAAWLRRESEDKFIAYSVNCSHLGCPVSWLQTAELFMCPCHGGVYYKDGSVAAGPPPRRLTQYEVRINQGQVEILTGPIPLA